MCERCAVSHVHARLFFLFFSCSSLCFFTEELSAIVTEERGILDVRNAMDIFKDHVETVEAANSAIYSLSLEGMSLHCHHRE